MADPDLTKAGAPRKRPPRPGEGRPGKYRQAYCREVENFMAGGYSLTAFAGHIGVAPNSLRQWREQHPEFAEAVARAQAKALLAWERDARDVAQGGGGAGRSTMICFALRNIAPGEWRDLRAQEVRFPDSDRQSPEQIAAALLRSFTVIGRMAEDVSLEP